LRKEDNRIYAGIQKALSQLDAQELETLQEIKRGVDAVATPCVEQFRAMYSDGYATGYAYFTLTQDWLHDWNRAVAPSAENAHIAGWHEGQIHARSDWESGTGSARASSAYSGKAPNKHFYKIRFKAEGSPRESWMFERNFTATLRKLAALSDEDKETMSRERALVVIPEGLKCDALFPEIYREAYADGYAFCKTKPPPPPPPLDDSGLELALDGCHMRMREQTPLRDAYISGWNNGYNSCLRGERQKRNEARGGMRSLLEFD
jgi:hypothetical protein